MLHMDTPGSWYGTLGLQRDAPRLREGALRLHNGRLRLKRDMPERGARGPGRTTGRTRHSVCWLIWHRCRGGYLCAVVFSFYPRLQVITPSIHFLDPYPQLQRPPRSYPRPSADPQTCGSLIPLRTRCPSSPHLSPTSNKSSTRCEEPTGVVLSVLVSFLPAFPMGIPHFQFQYLRFLAFIISHVPLPFSPFLGLLFVLKSPENI